jgi:hypothetical protein
MENEQDLNTDLVAALRKTTELQKDFVKESLDAGMEVLLAGREFVNVILKATNTLPNKSGAIVQEVSGKLFDGKRGIVPKTADVGNTLLFIWEAQTVTVQKAIPLIQKWNELWFKMVHTALSDYTQNNDKG